MQTHTNCVAVRSRKSAEIFVTPAPLKLLVELCHGLGLAIGLRVEGGAERGPHAAELRLPRVELLARLQHLRQLQQPQRVACGRRVEDDQLELARFNVVEDVGERHGLVDAGHRGDPLPEVGRHVLGQALVVSLISPSSTEAGSTSIALRLSRPCTGEPLNCCMKASLRLCAGSVEMSSTCSSAASRAAPRARLSRWSCRPHPCRRQRQTGPPCQQGGLERGRVVGDASALCRGRRSGHGRRAGRA